MGVICLAKELDISKFITSKREIVVFECSLVVASDVVNAVLHDSAYRSLSIVFVGYGDAGVPLVKIEVEFAVKL